MFLVDFVSSFMPVLVAAWDAGFYFYFRADTARDWLVARLES